MVEPHWKDCIEEGDDSSRKARKVWRVLKTLPIPQLNLDLKERDNDLGLTPQVLKQRIRNLEKETAKLNKSIEATMLAHAHIWDKFFVGNTHNGFDIQVVGVRKENPAEVQVRIDKARMAGVKEDQDLKRQKRRIMKRMIESDPKMAKRLLELSEKKADK